MRIIHKLDSEKNCKIDSFFYDGEIRNHVPDDEIGTWSDLIERNGKFAEMALLYAKKPFDECIPEKFNKFKNYIDKRLQAFVRSCVIAKIPTNQICIADILPSFFLKELFEFKTEITKYVFETYEKPRNYGYLEKTRYVIDKIGDQTIVVDGKKRRIQYNQFASKTGRVYTEKETFNILSFSKDQRHKIKPNNHFFLELDVNSAELSTLILLSEKILPNGDLIEYINDNIFERPSPTRTHAKQKIYSYLYGGHSSDWSKFDKNRFKDFINPDEIREKFFNKDKVLTPLNREIECDKFHSLNYLLQGTLSDLIFERAYDVMKILNNRKSKIAFIIHDCIVFDISNDELHLIDEIIKLVKQTQIGTLNFNVKIGKDYGNMNSLGIK